VSLIRVDGFDHYTVILDKLDDYYSLSGPPVINGEGRWGGGAVSWDTPRDYWEMRIEDSNDLIIGFAWKIDQAPMLEQTICQVWGSFDFHASLKITPAMHINAYGGSPGTKIGGTGTPICKAGGWCYIEWRIKVDNTVGTSIVWVDDVQVLNLTGQDTKGGSDSSNICVLAFSDRWSALTTNLDKQWVDDVYIMDPNDAVGNVTRLADVRVEGLLPNGAGNYSQWSRSGGSNNYEMVDENPPDDDTSYVYSATAGQLDSYTFDSPTPTGGTVFAAAVNLMSKKDSGGHRYLKALQRRAATDDLSDQLPVFSDEYNNLQHIFELDPTGAGWTLANLLNTEFGMEMDA